MSTPAHNIPSEAIEPVMGMILARMIARCEDAKRAGDRFKIEDACSALWMTMAGMQRLRRRPISASW